MTDSAAATDRTTSAERSASSTPARSAVTGSLQVPGRPDISGPIEGKVEGNTVKLLESSGTRRAPLLTVRGDQITGFVGGTTLDLRRSR